MKLHYDLHIHSALSPCADDDMTPNNIVNMALLKELDVIALTDHNTAGNLKPTAALAARSGLLFIPGMEVQTREDIHVLCLFETLTSAMAFDDALDAHRMHFPHRPERFGRQLLLDQEDQLLGEHPDSLLFSLTIGFETLHALTAAFSGLFIPAHIGRASFSVLSQLGFLPADSGITTVEINGDLDRSPYLGYHILTNSDAHRLGNIQEPIHTLDVPERSVRAIFDLLRRPVS